MYLNKGVVTRLYNKKRINGKGSTEYDLIGVDDDM